MDEPLWQHESPSVSTELVAGPLSLMLILRMTGRTFLQTELSTDDVAELIEALQDWSE